MLHRGEGHIGFPELVPIPSLEAGIARGFQGLGIPWGAPARSTGAGRAGSRRQKFFRQKGTPKTLSR